jgi:hypothetical protein
MRHPRSRPAPRQERRNDSTCHDPGVGDDRVGYVYDFGDNWEHRIIVEQTSHAETDSKYPRFLDGERRCPPEDCGGPPGYFDFMENASRKQSKQAKEALESYGGPYNLMILTWIRSTLLSAGPPTPIEQGDQAPLKANSHRPGA